MNKSVIGVVGLGVMGKSLSLNIAEKGHTIAVYNRTENGEANVVSSFLKENKNDNTIHGFTNLEEFVAALELPRKILLMIPAGTAIDEMIAKLLPFLSKNDIIIDGGNSHYRDTNKRYDSLKEQGIHFIGCGISGGEEGARKGPSIMPSGSKESYNSIAPILESIAAKDTQQNPCCAYIGPEGAGHFIKMVHNGIEYVEMQLLAELYAILSNFMDYDAIANLFLKWNTGKQSSYLLEITSDIFQKKEGDHYLLDRILDKAGNKGTGSWSSKTAFNLGTPNTMMSSAVFARYISTLKEKRKQITPHIKRKKSATHIDLQHIENAYRFARIINHHQGFELIKSGSDTYNWNLNLSEIAQIWTNGCIIKSSLMEELIHIFKENESIFENISILSLLNSFEEDTSKVLEYGLKNSIPLDTFSSGFNYWLAMSTENLPANLIQAQRDYFGAHTYQRTDATPHKFFHTNWLQND